MLHFGPVLAKYLLNKKEEYKEKEGMIYGKKNIFISG